MHDPNGNYELKKSQSSIEFPFSYFNNFKSVKRRKSDILNLRY